MQKFLLAACFATGLATMLVPRAAAHDLYLLPASFHTHKGATVALAFHNGDSFPESEAAPAIVRLKDAQLSGKAGVSTVRDLRVSGMETTGTAVAPGDGSLWLTVRTVPNFIELAPDKFLPYLKEEGLDTVIGWRAGHGETKRPGRERYTKYAKALLQSGTPDDFYRHPVGFPIEIVPLTDPSAVRAGGSLPVQVLVDGKPAVDLQVEAAWSSGGRSRTTIVGRTNADGGITIPIASAGKWRLHTLRMVRCAEPKVADWESYWASLTFETSYL